MDKNKHYRGINKIIIGESIDVISIIIGQILSVITIIYFQAIQNHNTITTYDNIESVLMISTVVIMFVSVISTVISTIFTLSGIVQSINLDSKFKEALVIIIIRCVLYIINYIVPNIINQINILSVLIDLWLIVAIIQGIINICDDSANKTLVKGGLNTMKYILILYSLGVLSNISYTYIIVNLSQINIGILMLIISMILLISSYIIYIRYLIKIKKQLITH